LQPTVCNMYTKECIHPSTTGPLSLVQVNHSEVISMECTNCKIPDLSLR